MAAPEEPSIGAVPDVFLSGLLFYDIGFTGLDTPPAPGTEIWTKGMGSSPGGIANFAVALSRLGLRTSLAAAFGDDLTGTQLWEELAGTEKIDLSHSRRFAGWPTPITVSLAYDGDRALVTHGQAPPLSPDELIGTPPPGRAAVAHLGPEPQTWIRRATEAGTMVFADAGWEEAERWGGAVLEQLALCHAFLPNADEAMAYTRTATPQAALSRLADLVPLAVVTCGSEGAYAVDSTTGESASVRGLKVDALDATGAGDVFGAALVAATLAGWPLADRLRFANLVASLSVQRIGGAAAAPRWPDIALWWRALATSPKAADLRREYAFLDDVIPSPEPTNGPFTGTAEHVEQHVEP
ncbi:carbohydrate kinase family protein [Actinacidiphila oryziradicis]|uniref:carbohydrate kinase family protein n=1 Tax=Actinacidiphila oryziradicis TaxID=2571141 RepID=UPI0023F14E98|nr:carbohydrate kinase family protein [Actinacidiphila oryziradicis]MCW2875620.1 carbohydrate kinase [Actinacidiphila oryziradicis]